MKHKIQVKAPVEKRGLHGIRKTVMETGTIENDGKTCKKLIFVVLWIVHSVIPVPPVCETLRDCPAFL